jgi:hypothetical protein
MRQGFSEFRSYVDFKSGIKGLKTGRNVTGLMYIGYRYSMECL